jgi:UDP-glucose 4-epimerase
LVGLAFHPDAVGRVFNVGSDEEVSIFELAERVRTVTHSRSQVVFVPYSQAYGEGFEDMQRRVPDTRRIQSLLDWKPELPLNETLVRVQNWMDSH